jgi:glycosyltransferase involved in cell wall biosynthesis
MVTVIIPVYNAESYLEQCLNSVINQDYMDLEIILIDDGSTDNSGKICDLYLTHDMRIRVIHQINHGVSYSRNQGIDASNGEYLTFIDCDDRIDITYI